MLYVECLCYNITASISLSPAGFYSYRESIFNTRNLFLSWHKEVKAGVAVTFPLQELDIKAFCVACSKAGFAYKRIIENFSRGLCMWVSGLQKTY